TNPNYKYFSSPYVGTFAAFNPYVGNSGQGWRTANDQRRATITSAGTADSRAFLLLLCGVRMTLRTVAQNPRWTFSCIPKVSPPRASRAQRGKSCAALS